MKRFHVEVIRKVASRRPAGYLEDVMSSGSVENDWLYLQDDVYEQLSEKYREHRETVGNGPGAQLKGLLRRLGFQASPNCACNKRSRIMDERGIPWCEQNVETICDWLAEEAGKRGLPFVRAAARLLVRMAIRNAKAATNK